MNLKFLTVAGYLTFLCFQSAPSRAQSGALPPREKAVEAAPPATVEEPDEEASPPGIYAGADIFAGRTNLEDARRLRDGFWPAGTGPAYPSNLYLRVLTRRDVEAKVSLGVGRLFRDAATGLQQPVEAWVRVPIMKAAAISKTAKLQKATLTAGKFYVPFALQEWEYETKWGAMLELERGKTSLALAATHNRDTRRPNFYARVGRDISENFNVGVSVAGGKGLSYGSDFDRAVALDFSAARSGWNLSGEQLWMKGPAGEKFRFRWLRLSTDKFGKLQPFIARYDWKDSSDSFGDLRATALGLGYQLSPELALEGGYTFSSEDDVVWVQLHFASERRLAPLGAASPQPLR